MQFFPAAPCTHARMAKNGGWSPDVNQVEATSRFIGGTECGKAKIYFLVRKGDTLEIKNVINAWIF